MLIMDITNIKYNIESMTDEVDIVQSYSIAIEHLEELMTQINFVDNPVSIRNDINKTVHKYFIEGCNDAINQCRDMIKFHLNHGQNRNKDIVIKDKQPKLSFQFASKN
jgi:hypothetical protein